MNPVLIKKARINDLPRIKYITRLAYQVPYKGKTVITKPHESKNLKPDFQDKKFFALVAIFNSKIIGAVRYQIKNKNLYFFKLAVLKTFRQKGIGSLLIKRLEKIAQKKGCRKITLSCVQEKQLPQYYKKLGYKISTIKKHHQHHDVYMFKLMQN